MPKDLERAAGVWFVKLYLGVSAKYSLNKTLLYLSAYAKFRLVIYVTYETTIWLT